jgi:Animal haem peroxidase
MTQLRRERETKRRYEKRFLVGEDLFVETPHFAGGIRLTSSSASAREEAGAILESHLDAPPEEPVFRFGRMFRQPYLPEYRPDPDDLIKLGLAMKAEGELNRKLPAGYTVLGQFIDHDITFDPTQDLAANMEPEQVESQRSPSLDLDSLYGLPPLSEVVLTEIGKHVYQPEGVNLAFGTTVFDPFVDPQVKRQFPNDLPRGGLSSTTGMIIDPRNDENLGIAQTHLAFIKFHNAVVQYLSQAGVPLERLVEEARETVVQHYQWIVLNDYLPRIIEKDVLDEVIKNGCQHFVLKEGEKPYMPVEFSVAAFRLGHAMVTETYEWNRYFQSQLPNRPARLMELFNFTGFANGNLLAFGGLPGSWVIDWTRFYDFSHLKIKPKANSSFARKIGPSIVPTLTSLPFFGPVDEPLRSLAVRNLLRGRLLGLPAAQNVAWRLGITPLKPKEVAGGTHGEILRECGFDQLTPLWYYILREAEVYHHGERLGPIGSRIIAETFVQLIKSSTISILPKTGVGKSTFTSDLGINSMADLLFFIDNALKGENFLNPLGD